jgi:hypothetical protein
VNELPDLSVIVTVVEGGATLLRCLSALRSQDRPPSMEVIIPYDDTVASIGLLAKDYPEFEFLALGALRPGMPSSAFEEHELFDLRRSGGLRRAHGPLLAMLEDRGWPKPDWARQMVELHKRHSDAAIGGAVECVASDTLRWAAYVCDFGRYQPPLDDRSPEYLSDINICYKREPFERFRALWQVRYQEATVNWALRRSGESLRLSDKPVVVQERGPIGLWGMVQERFHWGRVFGQARAHEAGLMRRLLWAATAPSVPMLLFARHVRCHTKKRQWDSQFMRSIPAILALLHLWCLGELIGNCEVMFARRARLVNLAAADSLPQAHT